MHPSKINIVSPWHPLGLAMEDFFNGNFHSEIIIKSNLAGEERVPVETFFREPEALTGLEEYAISLCTGSVLDAGAGSGTHALTLQESGLDVTAIDIMPQAVDIMRKKGIEKTFVADIFTFTPADVKFDTILMMMNGIGLAGDEKGLKVLLKKLKRLLTPNGQVLFDSSELRPEDYPELPHDDATSPFIQQVNYSMSYKNCAGSEFTWYYPDQETINTIAGKCGWMCQVIYEDENGHYLARLKPIS